LTFGTCPKLWPGQTFVCIASGPSLRREDVEQVKGRARVIAVNRAVDLAPWSDVLYACDADWWRSRGGEPGFVGLKFSLRPVEFGDVITLQFRRARGIETDPQWLASGGNSGYQAINLAVHLGARRIVLLGYDLQPGPAGVTHFHGDHGAALRNPGPDDIARWARCFPSLVGPLAGVGIEIVNCSRRTALDCFPRSSIEDEVASWPPSPKSSTSATF
jgi:hypothetical protein